MEFRVIVRGMERVLGSRRGLSWEDGGERGREVR